MPRDVVLTTWSAAFIRVNAPGSAWFEDDLTWAAALAARIDAIVRPKAETASAIERVAGAAPSRRAVPLLETARIMNASAVLSAEADIPAVLFGLSVSCKKASWPRPEKSLRETA